jgi:hypothetical protein
MWGWPTSSSGPGVLLPADAPDNLDAPRSSATAAWVEWPLRHSADTWWAMHRPVSTAARVLTRGAQRLSAPAGASSATRPASSRATGMRNGEQET